MRQKGFMLIELILFTIVGALFAAGALAVVKEITEYQRQVQTTDKTKLIAFALSKLRSSDAPTNSTQFNDFLNGNFGSNLDPWSRPYRAVMATNVNDACNATSTDLAVQLPNGQVVQNVIALIFTPGNKPPDAENTLTLNGLNQNETFFKLSRGVNNPLRISVGDLYALKTLTEYQAEACGGGGGSGGSGCPNNTIINPPPGIIRVSPGQSVTICIDGEHRINGDLIVQRTGNLNSTGNYTAVKFMGKNGGTLRVNGSFVIQNLVSSNNETVVDITDLRLIVQGNNFSIDFFSVVFDNSSIMINSNSITIGSTMGWIHGPATARVTFKNSSGTINGNYIYIGYANTNSASVQFNNNSSIEINGNYTYIGYAYNGSASVQFNNNSSFEINGSYVYLGYGKDYSSDGGYYSTGSAQFSDNSSITISGSSVYIGYGDNSGSAQFSDNGSIAINGGNIYIGFGYRVSSTQLSNSNITGSGILNLSTGAYGNVTLSNSQITNFAQINISSGGNLSSCLIRGGTITAYLSSITSCRLEASNGNITISASTTNNSTFRVPTGREVYFYATPTGTGNCFEKRLRIGGTPEITYNAPAITPWGQVLQSCP